MNTGCTERVSAQEFWDYVSSGCKIIAIFEGDCCAGIMLNMKPLLTELFVRCEGKVKIMLLDAYSVDVPAGQFDVHSIPTIIGIDQGREVYRKIGYRTYEYDYTLKKIVTLFDI